ncbi:hypothetical protein MKEN_00139800 [Mycena kentingensis (nom. inval.)]|nr:hypothetical protein MKEN_00139800 [Mycena kentingensis (nom. inval.)]
MSVSCRLFESCSLPSMEAIPGPIRKSRGCHPFATTTGWSRRPCPIPRSGPLSFPSPYPFEEIPPRCGSGVQGYAAPLYVLSWKISPHNFCFGRIYEENIKMDYIAEWCRLGGRQAIYDGHKQLEPAVKRSVAGWEDGDMYFIVATNNHAHQFKREDFAIAQAALPIVCCETPYDYHGNLKWYRYGRP